MRDYGRVHGSFWTSDDTRGLSEDGRTLALYLLTSPHSNIIGCFRAPDAYVSDDLQWSSDRVSKGFDELFRKGFATRVRTSSWVVIHPFLKWNPLENPNQVKAATKAFQQIPCAEAKRLMAQAFLSFGGGVNRAVWEPFRNPSETLPKPFRNQDQDPKQEQEQDQERERAATAVAPRPPPSVASKKTPLGELSDRPDVDDPDVETWLLENGIPALDASDGLAEVETARAAQGSDSFGAPVHRPVSEPFRNPSETVPEPFRNQDQDQDPEQEQEQERERAATPVAPRPRPFVVPKRRTLGKLSPCPDVEDPDIDRWLSDNGIPALDSGDGSEVDKFLNHHTKKGSNWASWRAAWRTWTRSDFFRKHSGPSPLRRARSPTNAVPDPGEPPPLPESVRQAMAKTVPADRQTVLGLLGMRMEAQ